MGQHVIEGHAEGAGFVQPGEEKVRKLPLWLAKSCPSPERSQECRAKEWPGILYESAWPELQLPDAGELWMIFGCPLKPVRRGTKGPLDSVLQEGAALEATVERTLAMTSGTASAWERAAPFPVLQPLERCSLRLFAKPAEMGPCSCASQTLFPPCLILQVPGMDEERPRQCCFSRHASEL